MKISVTRILFILLVLILNGCGGLTTLYPIFYTTDIVYDPSVLGTWKYSEDHHIKFVEFRKISADKKRELPLPISNNSDKGYFMTRTDSTGEIINQSFTFLVRIGSNYYFDNYPAEPANSSLIDRSFKDMKVKAHSSYRVDITDKDHISIKAINRNFMEQLITSNKINIRHTWVDGKILITAGTAELQKFIIQYGNNPKMFVDEIKCERVNYY